MTSLFLLGSKYFYFCEDTGFFFIFNMFSSALALFAVSLAL